MGAWGAKAFENDDALDWLSELEQAENLNFIRETLLAVIESEDQPEAPECSAALAAAELVAALNEKAAKGLPAEITRWVAACQEKLPVTLLRAARTAVRKIRTDSELKELWDEAEDAKEWHREIAALEKRLE